MANGVIWSKGDVRLGVRGYINPQTLKGCWVPRQLADGIARWLSVIFDSSWPLGEVPKDWKKANVTPIFKKENSGNYRLVSLMSVPRKVAEQLSLETISRLMNNNKIIRNIQHGFTEGKSCLTNMITLYDETTGLADEGRLWILSTYTCARFWTLSPLRNPQSSCRCAGWMRRQEDGLKNWMNSQAQSGVICAA